MEYDFDGTVKVNPKLVLHSTDRIVIAAEAERPNPTGYRSHVLVLDKTEGLPMEDGLLGMYASYDPARLESILDYRETRSNRELKARFVEYVRRSNGSLSFHAIHEALATAFGEEEKFMDKRRSQLAFCGMMDELERREFSPYAWQFVLD